jgi:phosphatidylserine/phosphatidylglycerophosphate/cardiolipin synthase-like enzyme
LRKTHLSVVVSAALLLSLLGGCNTDNNVKFNSLANQDHNILKQNQVNIPSNTTKFSDVPSTEWYAENIQWGSSLGIIDGYPDGTFQPNRALTRAEVIKIIKSLADKGYIAAGATNAVSYAFTQAGDHPENVLVNVIGEAKQRLDIAIYSLTLPSVVQSILDAHNRGVAVRILSDKTEAGTKSQSAALNQLAAAGIPIKINKHSGLMHLKVTIVDSKIFTSGSFNYSNAASTTNDEVLLVDRDPVGALKWDQQFERMWNDTSGFVNFPVNTAGNNPSAGTTPQIPDVSYASCADVRAAGKAPLHRGEPGYSSNLDRDGDGVACE